MPQETAHKFAIRFGLGAIKAVGFGMMENAIKEREENGKFKDIYDFAKRLDPRSINKKSIEALAKAGAFDLLNKNRRQISESFDILSSYSAEQSEAASSNQMSLFGGLPEANKKPELKKVEDWSRVERLQKEFEAFGFFLNEHPVDEFMSDLKKRGVIFSDKIERDELQDNNLVKISGVVAGSKHRSGPRGRFAYLTMSDPLGIYEAMIFDEALITNARDLLVDGSMVTLECLIRKDDGGIRILVRDVKKLEDFIRITPARNEDFEDIKQQPARREYNRDRNSDSNAPRNFERKTFEKKPAATQETSHQDKIEILKAKKILPAVQIILKERDAIIGIKSLLSQRLAPQGFEKFTKVYFVVMRNGKITKVELSEKYLIDNADILKMRAISGIIDVEAC